MFKKIFFASLLATIMLSAGLNLVYAQEATTLIPADHKGPNSCPSGYTGNCGDYNVDDFLILAINASRIILGLVGSLTLLMLVYGGFTFLISGGSSETVGQARKIIVAAVVGLLIVFTSFLIIKFVLKSMGVDWNGEKIDITKTANPITPTDTPK